jgi:hypothetical protein
MGVIEAQPVRRMAVNAGHLVLYCVMAGMLLSAPRCGVRWHGQPCTDTRHTVPSHTRFSARRLDRSGAKHDAVCTHRHAADTLQVTVLLAAFEKSEPHGLAVVELDEAKARWTMTDEAVLDLATVGKGTSLHRHDLKASGKVLKRETRC